MPRKRPEQDEIHDPFPQLRETLSLVQKGTDLSFLALEGETNVERRKLQRIVEGENVSLTLYELRQLDRFLATLGVDLFWKKDVPQLLAEAHPVSFLVPVSNTPRLDDRARTVTSLWDVRAMNQIRELLGRSLVQASVMRGHSSKGKKEGPDPLGMIRETRQAGFLVRPVPSDHPLSAPGVEQFVADMVEGAERPPPELKEYGDPQEFASSRFVPPPLADAHEFRPPVVISLGSPRASVASEYMLRRMFDLSAPGSKRNRDFYFVWHQPTALDRDSRFASDIEAFDPGELSIEDGTDGAVVREAVQQRSGDFLVYRSEGQRPQVRLSRRRPKSGVEEFWPSYGIVAIQRRADQIWLVIAGLTGPDTLAIAHLLEKFTPVLVPANAAARSDGARSRVSCVAWWVVQTQLHDPNRPIATDLRSLRHFQPISGPNYFWPSA